MYAGCGCKLEDVMMKYHHKCNVDFNSFIFISRWVYIGFPREYLWMSSTIDAHVAG